MEMGFMINKFEVWHIFLQFVTLKNTNAFFYTVFFPTLYSASNSFLLDKGVLSNKEMRRRFNKSKAYKIAYAGSTE
jgi:hypothetical protein